jgi:GDP-4-dehydro-6-deoxy-D-mannose reductase
MINKCLITGCGGFIGSHLAEFLLERGLTVFGIVHEDSRNIEHLKGRLDILKCDIMDKDSVESILAEVKPDYVFHLAAQSLIPLSWRDPEKTFKLNILGTLNLLDSIRGTGIEPVIEVTGSSAEYGFSTRNEIPIKETTEVRPSSPYGVSKIAESALAYLYWQTYGMKIIRLRPFYIIGTRKTAYACADFARGIAEIEAGQRDWLSTGNLETIRDPVDVRDAVRAMWLLAEKGKPGEVYNICSGKEYSMKEILYRLVALSRQPITVLTDPGLLQSSAEPVLVGDCSKLKKLGWQPQIPIEKTLADILEYWRHRI